MKILDLFKKKVKRCNKCTVEIEQYSEHCFLCYKLNSYVEGEAFETLSLKIKYYEMADYIFNYGVTINGVEWYIKSRNKLLNNIDCDIRKVKKKEMLQRQKTKMMIDKLERCEL